MSEDNLTLAQHIIVDKLKRYAVKIYLFGSHARGNARPTSDIDVGILPQETLPIGLLSEIREALFESTLPVTVDVVDLSQTDEQFKQKVLSEAIVWKD